MRISRWDEAGEPDDQKTTITGLAHWHLRQVSTTESTLRDRLSDLIDRWDCHGLCTFDLPIVANASDQYHCAQVIAFFKKRRDLDIGIDTKAVAVKEFYRCESACWVTNDLFRRRARGELTFSPRVEAVLDRARQKIAQILGPVPDLAELKLRFGPGATTDLPRRKANAQRKLHMPFTCSEDLLRILSKVMQEMPAWTALQGIIPSAWPSPLVKSAKASFVLKNAKTDRGIASESQLNVMVQLGVGSHIAGRLRREGIDIRDQTRNQKLALLGSLNGCLATLDLSSASDLICYMLVLDLLPVDWVDFLDAMRSNTVVVEGKVMRLAKFSSMGNGFTFPLETLIFYALAWASQDIHCVGDSAVSVYGDDIIVPVRSVPLLVETLTVVGFRVNKTKSFWQGPFRESCGKDYHSGIDVRPVLLKGGLTGMTLFTLHNFYVRRGLSEPASLVLAEIPTHLRLWGPDGYGDGHLVGDWKPKPYRRKRGWSGCTFDTFAQLPVKESCRYPSDCILPSYSIYISPPCRGLADLPQTPLQRMNEQYGRVAHHHGASSDELNDDHLFFESMSQDMDFENRLLDAGLNPPLPPRQATLPGSDGYTRKSIYVLA